jgi:hypothetical protein
MVGRPEAEKSGLLNCRMSHSFNVSSPDRNEKQKCEFCTKNSFQVYSLLNFVYKGSKKEERGGKD